MVYPLPHANSDPRASGSLTLLSTTELPARSLFASRQPSYTCRRTETSRNGQGFDEFVSHQLRVVPTNQFGRKLAASTPFHGLSRACRQQRLIGDAQRRDHVAVQRRAVRTQYTQTA